MTTEKTPASAEQEACAKKPTPSLVALADEMETVFSDLATIHLAIRGMVFDIAKSEPQSDEGGGLEDVAFRAVQRARKLRTDMEDYCAAQRGGAQ